MKRRLAPWFGAGLVILVIAVLAAFGSEVLADPVTAALLSGLAVAAGLSIGGGVRESVTIGSSTLPWNVLVGASDVLLALVVAVSSVRTAAVGGTERLVFAAGGVAGGAALAWFGVQTARDTRHVDLEASPSRARVAAVGALAAASMVGGFLAVTVV